MRSSIRAASDGKYCGSFVKTVYNLFLLQLFFCVNENEIATDTNLPPTVTVDTLPITFMSMTQSVATESVEFTETIAESTTTSFVTESVAMETMLRAEPTSNNAVIAIIVCVCLCLSVAVIGALVVYCKRRARDDSAESVDYDSSRRADDSHVYVSIDVSKHMRNSNYEKLPSNVPIDKRENYTTVAAIEAKY